MERETESDVCIHICIYMHACIHAWTHTYIQTNIQTWRHATYIHTFIRLRREGISTMKMKMMMMMMTPTPTAPSRRITRTTPHRSPSTPKSEPHHPAGGRGGTNHHICLVCVCLRTYPLAPLPTSFLKDHRKRACSPQPPLQLVPPRGSADFGP